MIKRALKNKWFYIWFVLHIGAWLSSFRIKDEFSGGMIPLVVMLYILNFPSAIFAHILLFLIVSVPMIESILTHESRALFVFYFMFFGFLQWFVLIPKYRAKEQTVNNNSKAKSLQNSD